MAAVREREGRGGTRTPRRSNAALTWDVRGECIIYDLNLVFIRTAPVPADEARRAVISVEQPDPGLILAEKTHPPVSR